MLTSLRGAISSKLNFRTLTKHYSKLGWRDAPRYTKYLESARRAVEGNLLPVGELQSNVDQFARDGFTVLWSPEAEKIANRMFAKIKAREAAGEDVWDLSGAGFYTHQGYNGDLWGDFPEFEELFHGILGAFLENYYRSHFKIYYSSLLRSQRHKNPTRAGSQQWHNDAGPGTCIIVGFYLHPTNEHSGCFQCLNWKDSLEIYQQERKAHQERIRAYCTANNKSPENLDRMESRTLLTSWYDEVINAGYQNRVHTPMGKAGSMVAFRNNILHRGGFPDIGHERYIILTHVYPSSGKTPFQLYRQVGVGKKGGYPRDPAF